jgi:hypothetical protein
MKHESDAINEQRNHIKMISDFQPDPKGHVSIGVKRKEKPEVVNKSYLDF